ncbi:MAG: amidase family protein, partial [Clostridia bacterium]|nr:amidase family protein [Clostridia bacterium]
PTYGLVSRFGLVAFASSLDQIGPLTKDVTDSAMVMNLIAGHDCMDSTSINYPKEDYTKALVNDVKGMKIGVPNDYIGEGINQDVKNAILKAVETYKMLGAEVDFFDMQASKYALPAYYIISSAEASSNLARYDGIKYGYRTDSFENLDDLYKKTRSEGFGKEVKRRIMLGTYALSSGYYDAYYKKAQQVRTVIKNDFDAAFEKYDFILTPTAPTTAFNIGSKTTDPLQMYLEDICTVSINIASVPAISIPCGFDKDNMPIGMQLIGKAFSESTLLRAAYTFEQNADIPNIRPQL